MDQGSPADDLVDEIMGREIDILTFPSHFNVAIQIRRAVSNPDASLEEIADIVKRDPLISVKILQEASRRNSTGVKFTNLARAINTVGFDHVKRIALFMAMKQLNLAKPGIRYSNLSRLIWLNSLYAASAAHVITDNLTTRIDPEEAFMCGIMLNMGAFYLLHQVSQVPGMHDSLDSVIEGIEQYYLARTLDILMMFDMSPVYRIAVAIDKIPGNDWLEELTNLRMVVKMANKMAGNRFPWISHVPSNDEPEMYKQLRPEIDIFFDGLRKSNY